MGGKSDEPVLRVHFDFYSSHNILRMFECYLDYREEVSLKNYSFPPPFSLCLARSVSLSAHRPLLYDHYRP